MQNEGIRPPSNKKTMLKDINIKNYMIAEQDKNISKKKNIRTSQSNQNSHSKLNTLKQSIKEKIDTTLEEKNYSCDKKNNQQQILLQNFMNINININSKDSTFQLNHLNEILDNNKCLEIMKKKLDKKKEKIKTNILNFSNPTKINIPPHFKFLIDSSHQKNNKDILKTNQSNKKTKNSIYDFVDNNKTIEKSEKTSTPRLDSIFEKYTDIISTKMAIPIKKDIVMKNDISKNFHESMSNKELMNIKKNENALMQTKLKLNRPGSKIKSNIDKFGKNFNQKNLIIFSNKDSKAFSKTSTNTANTSKNKTQYDSTGNLLMLNSLNLLNLNDSPGSTYRSLNQKEVMSFGVNQSKKDLLKNYANKNINGNLFKNISNKNLFKQQINEKINNCDNYHTKKNCNNNINIDTNIINITEGNQINQMNNTVKNQVVHNKKISDIPLLSSLNFNKTQKKIEYNSESTIKNSNFSNIQFSNKNIFYGSKYGKAGPYNVINSSLKVDVTKEEEITDGIPKIDSLPQKKFPINNILKKTSQNNSKSITKLDDIDNRENFNLINNSQTRQEENDEKKNQRIKSIKSNVLMNKFLPITTSSSPKHLLNKELLKNMNLKKEEEIKSINITTSYKVPESGKIAREKSTNHKFFLDLNKIKSMKKNPLSDNAGLSYDYEEESKYKVLLETSNESIRSTMREALYYRREAEKLYSFIKNYFNLNGDYPTTNEKFYKFGRLLGRGAFGKVNLGLHVATGRLVAIKTFNKTKFKSSHSLKKIFHESSILRILRNESIVKIFDFFENSKYIGIVMEYISCGDLLSFVRKRSKLSEPIAKFIFKQIIEALEYIHSKGIVHRDIKLDNILIDLQNNIKICDFGVSKQIKKGDIMNDQCGTPAYIAPEILRSQGYEGFSVDIWSSGVVLYAMLSGTVPFKANSMRELHLLIMKGQYNEIKDISQEAKNLITSLLELDPKKRITTEQILNHNWLKSCEFKQKSKVNLFTDAEKILLSKSNIDFRFANRDDIIENFSRRNLDTLLEQENLNVNTKSIILAPFNSSHQGMKNSFNSNFPSLKIENNVIKFCGKVKELNRNYELNNNGEIDNGIIIPAKNLSINSNDSNNIQSPQMIHSPMNISIEKKGKSKQGSHDVKCKYSDSNENSSSSKNSSKTSKANSSNNILIFNEKCIREVEGLGYKKEYIIKCLIDNELNYATASYYILDSYMHQ